MATTFSAMKIKVADWLKRSDLSSVLGDFINTARHRLEESSNYWTMLAQVTGTLSTDTITFATLNNGITDYHTNTYGGLSIPAGRVKSIKSIRLTCSGKNTPITIKSYDELISMYPWGSSETGQPIYAAVDHIQQKVIFRPYPDSSSYTYEIFLWERHGDLTTDEHTDQTMQYHWEVVLFGALLEATPYLINDPRVALWQAKYTEAKAHLKAYDIDAQKIGDTARVAATVEPDV
jgi:hypothetical protein